MKNLFIGITLAITMTSAALWLGACQKETTDTGTASESLEVTDRANANSKVFPPSAHPYGTSYTDWTVLWMHQFMSFDCDDIPFFNPGNELFYQTGPVYFMAGLMEEGASADITIPHGKAILFPLVNYLNDYPCPGEGFEPAPGQTLEEFLTEYLVELMASVENLSVTIDGASVSNPENYLFTSELFNFTANPLLTCIDPCVTGTSQQGVTSGYYMMLKPLSRGEHTVHYHMELPWAVQDGTFNITVN